MALGNVLGGPVWLTDPLVGEPRATPGCDVCGALLKQWRQATEQGSPAYDPSHASDLRVEMSRHPHQRPSMPPRSTSEAAR